MKNFVGSIVGAGICVALACGDKSTTTAAVTDTDGPLATTGTTDTPTGDSSDTGTTGASEAPSATETSQTTDEPTGPADTTIGDTEDSSDAYAACLATCAHLEQCDGPQIGFCGDGCRDAVGIYGYPGPGCLDLYVTWTECLGAVPCDQIEDAFDTCIAEYDATNSETCASDVCLAHADKVLECGFIDPQNRISHAVECSYAVGDSLAYGEACLEASEALYACIAAAPCEQIESGAACDDKEAEQKSICGL